MKVKFKFFGQEMEAELESFAEYLGELCEFVQAKGENWEEFYNKYIEIIKMEEVAVKSR